MLTNVAGVQFQRTGKIYDFFYKNMPLQVGDEVWVDDEQGVVLARVAVLKYEALEPGISLKSVVRLASPPPTPPKDYPGDEEVHQVVEQAVKKLKLKMKIIHCELQPGGTKILVYFSAENRIDFRDLVKDLAQTLKSRVELRQIGARDEAKKVGGVGVCGRAYCCSTFLREFVPVSIKMAKNQNLALNPSQIMGGCGKLLCCLTYEDDLYTHLRRSLPPTGSRVRLKSSDEEGYVSSLDLLGQGIWWRKSGEKKRTYSPIDDLEVLEKATSKRSKKSKTKQKKTTTPQKDPQKTSSDHLNDTWGDDMDMTALIEFHESQSSSQKMKNPQKNQSKTEKTNQTD